MKYLFLFFFLVLCSCSDEYGDCAGGKARKTTATKSSLEASGHSDYSGCEPPPPSDNIKPSSEKLWFNAKGGIDSITTEGEYWYMTTLEIGDTVIFLHSNEYYVRGELEDLHLYESGIILINEENGYDVINIENSWFNINKPENKKIIFSVDKNETKKERKFFIHLVEYKTSYHTFINVNQSAD